jgi:MYXO-CTERM domain-containing protein
VSGSLVLAALLAADVSLPPRVDPIVGGDPTGPGEYDATVAILVAGTICTGTVVTPRLIITAAHCLAGLPSSTPLEVAWGQEVTSQDRVPAAGFGVHPDFCPTCKKDIHDLAYVLLPSDFVLPEYPLPIVTQSEWDDLMQPGTELQLVGYGADGSQTVDQGIGTKREVTTKMGDLTPKGLEFYTGGGGKDSCVGDSGGPAFATTKGGAMRLAGILSRGSDPCGKGGYYGVPYAGLCWIRDDTGIDLLEDGCDCDCLHTAPDEKGCHVGAPPEPSAGLALAVVAWIGGRRRRHAA